MIINFKGSLFIWQTQQKNIFIKVSVVVINNNIDDDSDILIIVVFQCLNFLQGLCVLELYII